MAESQKNTIKAEWRDYYEKCCDKSFAEEAFQRISTADIANLEVFDEISEEFKEFCLFSSEKLLKKNSFFDFL